jgi:hypothetical protein
VFWLAGRGAFVSGHDEPPVALAIAFLTPTLVFLVSLRIPNWRALVVSIPPVFLIALNSWRFIGLGSATQANRARDAACQRFGRMTCCQLLGL